MKARTVRLLATVAGMALVTACTANEATTTTTAPPPTSTTAETTTTMAPPPPSTTTTSPPVTTTTVPPKVVLSASDAAEVDSLLDEASDELEAFLAAAATADATYDEISTIRQTEVTTMASVNAGMSSVSVAAAHDLVTSQLETASSLATRLHALAHPQGWYGPGADETILRLESRAMVAANMEPSLATPPDRLPGLPASEFGRYMTPAFEDPESLWHPIADTVAVAQHAYEVYWRLDRVLEIMKAAAPTQSQELTQAQFDVLVANNDVANLASEFTTTNIGSHAGGAGTVDEMVDRLLGLAQTADPIVHSSASTFQATSERIDVMLGR